MTTGRCGWYAGPAAAGRCQEARWRRGESPWEAAAREAQEESGVAVEVTAFCGLSYTAEHSVCNLLFRGRSRGGTATAQPAETLDAAFFPRGEALALVNYRNFRERIEMSLDPSSHGFFLIA